MLDKLLQQYADKFEDNFPIFYVRHLDEKEIEKLIEIAIKEDKAYIAKYKDEGVY